MCVCEREREREGEKEAETEREREYVQVGGSGLSCLDREILRLLTNVNMCLCVI